MALQRGAGVLTARRVGLILVGGAAALLLAGVAAAAVLLATAPGHRALRNWAVATLSEMIDGTATIGSVDGALWRAADLRSVVLAGRDGKPVIRIERLRTTFALTDMLRRRLRFARIAVIRPVIILEQDSTGRWNIERLFKITPHDSTRPSAPRPLVDLRDVALTDGTVIVRERPRNGERRERTFTGITADLERLRPSHPDSAAIVARIRQLSVRVSDPLIAVMEARGDVSLDGDSLRFAMTRVVLPRTRASATGVAYWGGRNLALDAEIRASQFAFRDVKGLVPEVPDEGAGSADLRARLLENGAVSLDVHRAEVRTERSVVEGRGTVTIGAGGGVAVRGLDAQLAPLDLAVLAPYVDSLPVRGLVRGRVRATGSLRDLTVDADVSWSDEDVADAPVNLFDGAGRLALGGPDEVTFRSFTARNADFDFGTIQHFAPSVVLDGRLRASGTLEGPWRGAQFHGVIDHVGAPYRSTLHGDVRLGLAEPVTVDADVVLDSLSFELLRRSYPAIPLRGTMRGRASVHGPLTAMKVDAALTGPAGMLNANGTVGAAGDAATVVAQGTFDSLDLQRLSVDAPPTALWGRWSASLRVPADTAVPATGTARADLLRGRAAGVLLGTGSGAMRLEATRFEVDFARLAFAGGTFNASGALGRRGGSSSQIAFTLRADTVGYLEPLLRWSRRAAGDSSAVKLGGSASITGRVSGRLAAWTLTADAGLSALDMGESFGRGLRAQGRLVRDTSGYVIAVRGSADSVAAVGLLYAPVGLALTGSFDSLAVQLNAGFMTRSAVRSAFTIWSDTVVHVRAESLAVDLPVHTWRLTRPATAVFARDVIAFDTMELRSSAGVGYVRATGTLPRQGVADFALVADSVSLADVYALLQRDTTGVNGAVNGTVSIVGRAEAPAIEVRAALTDGRFGDYRLPLFQVLANYAQQRLTIKGGLWRDSMRIVSVNGSFPVDLSLQSVSRRKLPGDLSLVARADTLDMEVLGPLINVIRNPSGRMALDVRAEGTWDVTNYTGYVDIAEGSLRIPSLGAYYRGIDARFTLSREVMTVARCQLLGGDGVLDVSGTITFDSLFSARPDLRLGLVFSRFAAFDIPEFGAFTGSGNLQLNGPSLGATLTGRAVVDAGSLQFADLVQKRIVNLDDPEFRAMVDSSLTATADLGPSAHTVFFDSLRINNMTIVMGNDVWLRSSEANIQLTGEFQVDRTIESGIARYRLDGTMRTVRGTYKLVLGLENSFLSLSRDFRVTRGTVRFFGTPDFNPELDIVAENTVRTVQGPPLTVRAIIGGTLLYPQLRLESDQRPPLSETEIVSYLMFGQPPSNALSGNVGLSSVGGSFISGVGQALASELGLPLSYLTINSGINGRGTGQVSNGRNTTRLEAGAQLGDRTFLTLNAGLCEVKSSKLVGAGLEFRLTNRWTASTAFEPVIVECGTATALAGLTTRYQFGFDLFWQTGIR